MPEQQGDPKQQQEAGRKEQPGAEAGRSVVPGPSAGAAPDSARDPLRMMVEIAKDRELSSEDKRSLILHSQERFKNRRRMAYIALSTIVGSFILFVIAGFIDGLGGTTILATISENAGLLGTIEALLTSIVAAYYGVSAWRPSS